MQVTITWALRSDRNCLHGAVLACDKIWTRILFWVWFLKYLKRIQAHVMDWSFMGTERLDSEQHQIEEKSVQSCAISIRRRPGACSSNAASWQQWGRRSSLGTLGMPSTDTTQGINSLWEDSIRALPKAKKKEASGVIIYSMWGTWKEKTGGVQERGIVAGAGGDPRVWGDCTTGDRAHDGP